MTAHIDVRHAVRGTVRTTDSDLLDTIESAVTEDVPDTLLGAEFECNRHAPEDADEDVEELTARLTFAADSTEIDGEEVTPEDAAYDLYDSILAHDLAEKAEDWELQVYRTPEGGVYHKDVQKYYEAHPDEQPTDDDGNSYVPSSWDSSHHVVSQESSGE